MFKTGDKVMITAPCWQEECIVIKMGYSNRVMFVRRANRTCTAIYKSWASPVIAKNQQLLFGFMEK